MPVKLGCRRRLSAFAAVAAVGVAVACAADRPAASRVGVCVVAAFAAASSVWALTVHSRLRRTRRRLAALRADLAVAHTDPVTGLPARRVVEQHLESARTEVTVALVDVDDMHGINHLFNHGGGDRFLAEVATRLAGTADRGDVVARLGCDEFVVVTDQPPAALAQRLTETVTDPVAVGSVAVPMRLTVGICRVPGGDAHTAIGCADLAMFTAKRRGSGIEIYDPDRDGRPHPAGVRPWASRRDRDPRPSPHDGQ